MNNNFIIFSLTRPGIESVSTVSVSDALSTRPLVRRITRFSLQRFYTQRLTIRIAQSTSRVSIGVRGVGQEPRLDFEPNLVEFGPILPHGVGDEVDVVVRNPSPFAVEFYSLNFDKQYLLEEKVIIKTIKFFFRLLTSLKKKVSKIK